VIKYKCEAQAKYPFNIQKQIVSRIEEEQQLVDANKKLIKLYQGKIKETIDEVWGE